MSTRPASRKPASPRSSRAQWPYRMKDLCELTGLTRQVVHFYISQGLLPEGHKTGRNMAYYGEEHLQRLRTIRALQEERFLPLRAIRAVFTNSEGAFTAAQRRLLTEVKQRLQPTLGTPEGPRRTRPLKPLLAQCGVTQEEFDQIVEMGVLAVGKGSGGQPVIAEDDAWAIELWGQLRAAGFSTTLGFGPRDLAIYEDAIGTLFARETKLITSRLQHLPPAEVATMIERALPLIHTYLWRSHATKVRDFFSAL